MQEYSLQQLKRDIDALVEIVYRLNKYVKMEEIIKLISEVQTTKTTQTGQLSTVVAKKGAPLSLTDKIKGVLKNKESATFKDIFQAFTVNQWDNMHTGNTSEINKTKHRIRSIVASLKQRNKIVGNAIDGFRIKSKGGELF